MEKQKKLVTLALAAVVSTGLTVASGQAMAAGKMKMEKCYGIARIGMNDCGGEGAGHACQGQSKIQGDPNNWLFVPKGTCKKIVGGTPKPGKKSS